MPTKKKGSPKDAGRTSATPAKTSLVATASDAKRATNANKRRAQSLLDLIARRAARMTEDFYEVGKALRELLEKKLYVALGFTSFEAMLDARSVIGATQARKLIQVVSRMPLKTALELGLERAFATVKLTDATPQPDTPELLLEQGFTVGGKPLAEVTRRAIEEETKKVRKTAAAKSGKVDPAQREAESVAKRGSSWLKTRKAKMGKVEARRTKDGHVITITLSVGDAASLFGS